jgi:hypothetical protein
MGTVARIVLPKRRAVKRENPEDQRSESVARPIGPLAAGAGERLSRC